jgi:hypothetical protein
MMYFRLLSIVLSLCMSSSSNANSPVVICEKPITYDHFNDTGSEIANLIGQAGCSEIRLRYIALTAALQSCVSRIMRLVAINASRNDIHVVLCTGRVNGHHEGFPFTFPFPPASTRIVHDPPLSCPVNRYQGVRVYYAPCAAQY